MPTEPQPPTLAEVVNRAVDVVDPYGRNDAVAGLQARFEDRSEPITAVTDSLQPLLDEEVGRLDPQREDPALTVAAAVVVYLAFRRDEVADERENVLRLAVRAELGDNPPPDIAEWLAGEGVSA